MRAPAKTRSRFEQDRAQSGTGERTGGGNSRRAATDDDHVIPARHEPNA
jgi:hypothetical protein